MLDIHRPVLLQEVLRIFDPKEGEIYVDATVNGGGHAKAILERVGPSGKVVGIDWDCGLIQELRTKNLELRKSNLILICDNYANLRSGIRKHNLAQVSGILFDLGFSSHHLEEARRGFSFLRDEPLDMRYNTFENELTAAKIINNWPEKAIEDIFRRYGEERFARNIARGIARARSEKKVSTTGELVGIISKSVPRAYLRKRIHPATKIFQALRIAVNRELENLEKALKDSVSVLRPGGKIAVISFHSLEDRIVKIFFKERARDKVLKIITPKPLRPAAEEVSLNPRARSALLRVAEKI